MEALAQVSDQHQFLRLQGEIELLRHLTDGAFEFQARQDAGETLDIPAPTGDYMRRVEVGNG